MCRTSLPSFFLGLAVGGRVRLSPATARPFATSGPRVRGHSRFSPAAFEPRVGLRVSPALHSPSTRARTPRALLRGGGCRCFQAFSTPHLRYVFLYTTLCFLYRISFTNGSVYRGYRFGFSARFGPATHFSLGKIPPASTGFRMNAKKSVLLPSQRTLFLGVCLDSTQMQARLAPARISNFTACLARFKLGRHVSVGSCRRLLGLMAAASPVLPLGLLHMRPFLWWMKELRLHPTVPATRLIRVSRSCSRPLLQWWDPAFLRSGVRIGAIHHRLMVTTDASMMGWGAVFEGRPASGEWTGEFLSWHINCLELRAVFLALMFFSPSSGGIIS